MVSPVRLPPPQVCNHPQLCYPGEMAGAPAQLVRQSGKMYWLDRALVKLHAAKHRVLLFSTMTKLLDTVQDYLNWRQVGGVCV